MKKLFYFTCFTVVFLSFMILTFKIQLSNSVEQQVNKNISPFWAVSDRYDQKGEKTLDEFFSEEDSLKRLKLFNQALHENYNFLEYIKQSIEYLGYYSGEKRFIKGNAPPNQLLDINGASQYITYLNSIQFSEETWKYFDMTCDVGRGFVSSDYIGKNETIPVVLGHNYKNIYDIGDTITCFYLFQKRTLNVIGFLPSETKIFDNICDDYIIMPALNFSELNDTWNEMTLKILYAQKNNGKIINVEKSNGILENEEIIKVADKYDLKYSLLGYHNLQSNWIYCQLVFILIFSFGIILTSKKVFISRKLFFFSQIISFILAAIIFMIMYNIPNKEIMFLSVAYSCIMIGILNVIILKISLKS